MDDFFLPHCVSDLLHICVTCRHSRILRFNSPKVRDAPDIGGRGGLSPLSEIFMLPAYNSICVFKCFNTFRFVNDGSRAIDGSLTEAYIFRS